MRIKMKRIFMTVAALLCLGMMTGVPASIHAADTLDTWQAPENRRPSIPDPEDMAKRQADRLKEPLKLTDEQYKKVYKLYLKEYKARMQAFAGAGSRMGGSRGPMGPGFGGPGAMGGGGFPPMGMSGERPTPPSPEEREARAEERRKELEKRTRKLDKKMKKILTEEQYAQWKDMPPEAPRRHRPEREG